MPPLPLLRLSRVVLRPRIFNLPHYKLMIPLPLHMPQLLPIHLSYRHLRNLPLFHVEHFKKKGGGFSQYKTSSPIPHTSEQENSKTIRKRHPLHGDNIVKNSDRYVNQEGMSKELVQKIEDSCAGSETGNVPRGTILGNLDPKSELFTLEMVNPNMSR